MSYELLEADCLEAMAAMDEASVDAVVCDPPYGIGFMGHKWDQPGEYAALRGNGAPAAFAPGGAKREGVPPGQRRNRQPAPSGYSREGSRDKPLGAMEAGRYDLSLTANRRYQAWCEAWATEAFRILKPGGHLLASCGTRTYHRLAAGVEDAGFEIRDSLIWIYGSGFPKSLDVGKAVDKATGAEGTWREVDHPGRPGARDVSRAGGAQIGQINRRTEENPEGRRHLYEPASDEGRDWQGWGTALKPAHEPIVVARKPLAGTVADNVLAHGTGAINVDGCRIDGPKGDGNWAGATDEVGYDGGWDGTMKPNLEQNDAGRWPANVVLDEDAADELDRQSGEASGKAARQGTKGGNGGALGAFAGSTADAEGFWPADPGGGASRFFYCAKASRGERNAGLEGFDERPNPSYQPLTKRCTTCGCTSVNGKARDKGLPSMYCGHPDSAIELIDAQRSPRAANHHPTVKPVALMRWLCRLVTPPGGRILDPFTGSGTTGCAAVAEGFDFIGCEREAEYAAIARARIEWWATHPEGLPPERGPEPIDGQLGLLEQVLDEGVDETLAMLGGA